MTRLTLRSLATRKLRSALTAMAVVLGVAMISGTYVLTDTIDRAFSGIFQEAAEGVDVAVTPLDALDAEGEEGALTMDAALLRRVQATPGVEQAVGEVFSRITVNGKDGEPIPTQGPPTFAASVAPDRFEPFTPVEGRMPAADGEVALDRDTATDEGFEVGDTITVAGDPGAGATSSSASPGSAARTRSPAPPWCS